MVTARTGTGAGSVLDSLPDRHVRAVMRVLERCAGIDDPERFRFTVVDAIRSTFGIRDVTFFAGASYDAAFADPNPVLTGAAAPLLDEYQARWRDKDVFATDRARRILQRDGYLEVADLQALPAPQHSYVVDYLVPNGMTVASAIHLRTRSGDALVGMFDSRRQFDRDDVVAVRFLATQLRAHASAVSFDTGDQLRVLLSPRQLEVAKLVARGLSNAEIAREMTLTEQSVKKYVSRIFTATGCPNRAALTARVLTESPRGG
ncbi:helix-turn-helix transcriptional regulator [Gordonia sp. NB41Y]|uniref:helix-turn-helix transcriptional regulator n=1 Tax=Gordonia sp. NB41Y TaxID=875808 RepID=UPI0021C61DEC|nr:helix-turn-helix transcriptional regulator [Gordonia sp. NB41Y]WLP92332.1 helix-turn-helix transcriptional regulator [Gordonia sp. NB41Y]